eukprot:jgi/Botrbrau1/11252/Bobra.0038s0024.1
MEETNTPFRLSCSDVVPYSNEGDTPLTADACTTDATGLSEPTSKKEGRHQEAGPGRGTSTSPLWSPGAGQPDRGGSGFLDQQLLAGRQVRVANMGREGRLGFRCRKEGCQTDLDSPTASSALGSLPPGIEATPEQSEDGHDQTIVALTARVAHLEKQVSVLIALTAPLLNGETAVNHSSAFSNPLPTSTMYRLQLAGGSRSDSAGNSFAELPEAWGGPPGVPVPPVRQDHEEVVHMAATRVVMHQIVTHADVDQHGICPGGQVLSWIDISAGLAAKTVARGPVVTASVDSVQFLRPCRLGSTAIIAAMVNRIFSSSMEESWELELEPHNGNGEHSKMFFSRHRNHYCLLKTSNWLESGWRRRYPPQGSAFTAALLTSPSWRCWPSPPPRDPPPGGSPVWYPIPLTCRKIWESADRRRRERLERRQLMATQPEMNVPRLQPITHREGSPTLAPAIQVGPEGADGKKAVVAPSMTLSHVTQLIMPHLCQFSQHLLRRPGDEVDGAVRLHSCQSLLTETPHIAEVFHCGDAYVTVVSVDKNGSPVEVPFELQPVTEAEKRQCAGASTRREERLAMRAALLKAQERRRSLDGSMAWRGPASPSSPISP